MPSTTHCCCFPETYPNGSRFQKYNVSGCGVGRRTFIVRRFRECVKLFEFPHSFHRSPARRAILASAHSPFLFTGKFLHPIRLWRLSRDHNFNLRKRKGITEAWELRFIIQPLSPIVCSLTRLSAGAGVCAVKCRWIRRLDKPESDTGALNYDLLQCIIV